MRSASRKPRVVTSSVGSPLRSSSALVATVVPIFTHSTCVGVIGSSALQAEQVADAGDRRVAVLLGVLRQQLVRVTSVPSGALADDVGEGAAAVDPELPACRRGHALASMCPPPLVQQADDVVDRTPAWRRAAAFSIGRHVGAFEHDRRDHGPARHQALRGLDDVGLARAAGVDDRFVVEQRPLQNGSRRSEPAIGVVASSTRGAQWRAPSDNASTVEPTPPGARLSSGSLSRLEVHTGTGSSACSAALELDQKAAARGDGGGTVGHQRAPRRGMAASSARDRPHAPHAAARRLPRCGSAPGIAKLAGLPMSPSARGKRVSSISTPRERVI